MTFCVWVMFFSHCLPQLSVKGYNDKQHILLKKIIEKMATFEIDEKRFDIIKEAVSSEHTRVPAHLHGQSLSFSHPPLLSLLTVHEVSE